MNDCDEFYSLDESQLLNFNQFHQPLRVNKEKLNYKKFSDFNFQRFLAIRLQDHLKLFIMENQDGKWIQGQQVCTNTLGSQIFKRLSQKLINQKSHQNENDTFFQQFFDIDCCNSPDLLVKDIYGLDASSIGLPSSLLASSLGKLSKSGTQAFDTKQIVRSILMALAINTGQIAGLCSLKNDIYNIVLLKNDLGCIAFSRFVNTILKYTNPKANVYFKCQNNK